MNEIQKLKDQIDSQSQIIGKLKLEIAKEKEKYEDMAMERELYSKEVKKRDEVVVQKDREI